MLDFATHCLARLCHKYGRPTSADLRGMANRVSVQTSHHRHGHTQANSARNDLLLSSNVASQVLGVENWQLLTVDLAIYARPSSEIQRYAAFDCWLCPKRQARAVQGLSV